jgi:hypothetical protein
MRPPYSAFCTLCILLAGCTQNSGASFTMNGVPSGYYYSDANHQEGLRPSPQALHVHGTWLWPPQSADWP